CASSRKGCGDGRLASSPVSSRGGRRRLRTLRTHGALKRSAPIQKFSEEFARGAADRLSRPGHHATEGGTTAEAEKTQVKSGAWKASQRRVGTPPAGGRYALDGR